MMNKKLNKLIHNPKLFFIDALRKKGLIIKRPNPASNPKKENLSSLEIKTTKAKKVEPIVFAELKEINYFGKNTDSISFYNKSIKDKNLSSLILSPVSPQLLIHRPLWKDVLSDRSFIGFRDKFLFSFSYTPNEGFCDYGFLKTIFNSSVIFRQNMLENINNLIVVDPVDLTAFALKASNPFVNLIIIITENFKHFELLNYINEIGALVIVNNNEFNPDNIQCIEHCPSLKSSVNVLKKLIVDFNKKEADLLLPAFGREDNIVEKIDQLNENSDGVIFFHKEVTTGYQTFNEFIEANTSSIKSIYLKESFFFKHKELILDGNISQLLKSTLYNGVRYECFTA